jgi:hypothetical protein
MKPLILALAAFSLAAPCMAADKSDLAPAFKNTKLWLSADGTYKAQGRKGDASDGKWKLKGDQICLSQKHPFAPPIGYCTAVPTGSVGATWAAKSVFGDPIKVKLIKGGRG